MEKILKIQHTPISCDTVMINTEIEIDGKIENQIIDRKTLFYKIVKNKILTETSKLIEQIENEIQTGAITFVNKETNILFTIEELSESLEELKEEYDILLKK